MVKCFQTTYIRSLANENMPRQKYFKQYDGFEKVTPLAIISSQYF
jgi:hypothetical protein